MRLHICAIGRIRTGPERELLDDYIARFDRTGRALALGPINEHEIDERKATGMAEQGRLIAQRLPLDAPIVMLDERGKTISSRDFSRSLQELRDRGTPDLAFVIGGADGICADLRARADMLLSLGPMVWPHRLVRVMLCEQLYRAATILAGGPYHRD